MSIFGYCFNANCYFPNLSTNLCVLGLSDLFSTLLHSWTIMNFQIWFYKIFLKTTHVMDVLNFGWEKVPLVPNRTGIVYIVLRCYSVLSKWVKRDWVLWYSVPKKEESYGPNQNFLSFLNYHISLIWARYELNFFFFRAYSSLGYLQFRLMNHLIGLMLVELQCIWTWIIRAVFQHFYFVYKILSSLN